MSDSDKNPPIEVPGRGGAVEDQLAIQELLYRYAEALDNLDAKALSGCFAPGGVISMPGVTLEGDFAPKLIDDHRAAAVTLHSVLNHKYTIQADAATGVTYGITLWVVNKADERIALHVYSRYHDELIKQGHRWVFLKRHNEPLLSTEVPVVTFYFQGRDTVR